MNNQQNVKILFDKKITIEKLNTISKNSMISFLDIKFIEIGLDHLSAKMPVDDRHKQPYGILHGGANVVLAETLGSVASNCILFNSEKRCVGLEINANHIKSVKQGDVIGIAKPVHIGKSTHVWQIKIKDNNNNLVCISRITMAVLNKK